MHFTPSHIVGEDAEHRRFELTESGNGSLIVGNVTGSLKQNIVQIVLAKKLRQEVKTRKCAHNMMLHRMKFSFDYYVPQLIKLFRLSITNFIR